MPRAIEGQAAEPSLFIALDIDGTLASHSEAATERVDSEIRDDVREALAEARSLGARVVLATGRQVASALKVARDLDLDGTWAVCSKGAVTVRWDWTEPRGFTVVATQAFDAQPAVAALEAAVPDVSIAVEDVGWGYAVSVPVPDGQVLGAQRAWVRPDDLTQATAFMARSTAVSPEQLRDALRDEAVDVIWYEGGGASWLDVTAQGVNKATALEALRLHLKVPHAQTVAVGDDYNDVQMLRWAARGVAMGQAPDAVKDAAGETTGTQDEGGLARVLRDCSARLRSVKC